MAKGSMGKFVFKDVKDRWFFFYKTGNFFSIEYLQFGFWHHFKELFTNEAEIYHAEDIFFEGNSGQYNKIMLAFYQAIDLMGSKIPHNEFSTFNKDTYIWDLYALPFSMHSIKDLKKKILEVLEESGEYMKDIRNIVTEGIFVSVNLRGKAYLGMKEDPFRLARLDRFGTIRAGDDLSEIIEKASSIMEAIGAEEDKKKRIKRRGQKKPNSWASK